MSSLHEDHSLLNSDLFRFLDSDDPPTAGVPAVSLGCSSVPRTPRAARQTHPGPQPRNPRARNGNGADGKRSNRVRDVEKIRQLEALAAQKTAELASLAAHNTQLKHRHEVLSKALELRDYNLRIMYDTSGTCPAPPPSWAMSLPRTPAGVMAALGRPGGCHQAEQQWFRQHQGPTGSTTGAPAGPAPAPAPASSLAEAVWMPGSVALLLDLTSLPPVDREKIARISRSELASEWHRFLSSASTHLLALEERHGDEGAAEGLLAANRQMSAVFRHAALLASDTYNLVQQTHLATGELSAPDPQHWVAVVRAMELTEEQCREIGTVYELFKKVMAGIHAERQAIKRRLAEGLALNPTAACPPCGPGAGQGQGAGHGQGSAYSLGSGHATASPTTGSGSGSDITGSRSSTGEAGGARQSETESQSSLSSSGAAAAAAVADGADAGASGVVGTAGAAALSPSGSLVSPASPREAAGARPGAGTGGAAAGGGGGGSSCGEACMTRALLMSGSTVSPEQEVLPALERSMRQENSAHVLLRGFLMGRVLSIVQVARMAVKAYPCFPNFSEVVATIGEMAPGELAQMTTAAAIAAAVRGAGGGATGYSVAAAAAPPLPAAATAAHLGGGGSGHVGGLPQTSHLPNASGFEGFLQLLQEQQEAATSVGGFPQAPTGAGHLRTQQQQRQGWAPWQQGPGPS